MEGSSIGVGLYRPVEVPPMYSVHKTWVEHRPRTSMVQPMKANKLDCSMWALEMSMSPTGSAFVGSPCCNPALSPVAGSWGTATSSGVSEGSRRTLRVQRRNPGPTSTSRPWKFCAALLIGRTLSGGRRALALRSGQSNSLNTALPLPAAAEDLLGMLATTAYLGLTLLTRQALQAYLHTFGGGLPPVGPVAMAHSALFGMGFLAQKATQRREQHPYDDGESSGALLCSLSGAGRIGQVAVLEVIVNFVILRYATQASFSSGVAALSGAAALLTMVISRTAFNNHFSALSWKGASLAAAAIAAYVLPGWNPADMQSVLFGVGTSALLGASLVSRESLLKGKMALQQHGAAGVRQLGVMGVALLTSAAQVVAIAPPLAGLQAGNAFAAVGHVDAGQLALLLWYITTSGLQRLSLAWALRVSSAPAVQLLNAAALPLGAVVVNWPAVNPQVLVGLGATLVGVAMYGAGQRALELPEKFIQCKDIAETDFRNEQVGRRTAGIEAMYPAMCHAADQDIADIQRSASELQAAADQAKSARYAAISAKPVWEAGHRSLGTEGEDSSDSEAALSKVRAKEMLAAQKAAKARALAAKKAVAMEKASWHRSLLGHSPKVGRFGNANGVERKDAMHMTITDRKAAEKVAKADEECAAAKKEAAEADLMAKAAALAAAAERAIAIRDRVAAIENAAVLKVEKIVLEHAEAEKALQKQTNNFAPNFASRGAPGAPRPEGDDEKEKQADSKRKEKEAKVNDRMAAWKKSLAEKVAAEIANKVKQFDWRKTTREGAAAVGSATNWAVKEASAAAGRAGRVQPPSFPMPRAWSNSDAAAWAAKEIEKAARIAKVAAQKAASQRALAAKASRERIATEKSAEEFATRLKAAEDAIFQLKQKAFENVSKVKPVMEATRSTDVLPFKVPKLADLDTLSDEKEQQAPPEAAKVAGAAAIAAVVGDAMASVVGDAFAPAAAAALVALTVLLMAGNQEATPQRLMGQAPTEAQGSSATLQNEQQQLPGMVTLSQEQDIFDGKQAASQALQQAQNFPSLPPVVVGPLAALALFGSTGAALYSIVASSGALEDPLAPTRGADVRSQKTSQERPGANSGKHQMGGSQQALAERVRGQQVAVDEEIFTTPVTKTVVLEEGPAIGRRKLVQSVEEAGSGVIGSALAETGTIAGVGATLGALVYILGGGKDEPVALDGKPVEIASKSLQEGLTTRRKSLKEQLSDWRSLKTELDKYEAESIVAARGVQPPKPERPARPPELDPEMELPDVRTNVKALLPLLGAFGLSATAVALYGILQATGSTQMRPRRPTIAERQAAKLLGKEVEMETNPETNDMEQTVIAAQDAAIDGLATAKAAADKLVGSLQAAAANASAAAKQAHHHKHHAVDGYTQQVKTTRLRARTEEAVHHSVRKVS